MVDILAFGIHPDDVELGCSGTIARHIAAGKKVGILDLTQGELGTRGSAELRLKEAEKAAKILGVEFREILKKKKQGDLIIFSGTYEDFPREFNYALRM